MIIVLVLVQLINSQEFLMIACVFDDMGNSTFTLNHERKQIKNTFTMETLNMNGLTQRV